MNVSDGGSSRTSRTSTPTETPKPKETPQAKLAPTATPAATRNRDSFAPATPQAKSTPQPAPTATPTPAPRPTPTATPTATPTGTNAVAATTRTQAVNTGATDAAIAAQVASEVKAASAKGADAAQIMTLAHQRAVELVREQYPNAPPTERMDRAVAIATYVLNGPEQISNLAQVDSGKTKTVEYMRDIQANDTAGKGFAGPNLDSTKGGGTFYDAYSDGTANQAFHTNFFVAAGYVAGGDVAMALKAQAANIYHETVDPNAWGQGGGSLADFAASTTGIITGGQLIQARNYAAEFEAGKHPGGANVDLLQPVIVAGFVSDTGTPAPQVAGMNAAQQRVAQQTMTQISDVRGSWLYQLATEKNPAAALPIWFFELPPLLNGTKSGIN